MSAAECFSSIPNEWYVYYGVPAWACEVASGGRSVEAFLYYDSSAPPLEGFAILISSHLLLLDRPGGQPIFWLAMRTVKGMRCAERVMLPGKSFDCSTDEDGTLVADGADEARRVVTIDLFSTVAAVSMKVTGLDGEQFARAALSLWHLHHSSDKTDVETNGTGEDPFASVPETSVWHPGDALYACAGAPVRLSALMVQHPTDSASGTAVDLVMRDAGEVCIMRKPLSGPAVSWQAMLLTVEVERLALRDFALLSLPTSTTLRLVDRRGAVWAFGIDDDAATQDATRRLVELCLVGLLRRCAPRGGIGLRHDDVAALHRQYIALDPAGVGYARQMALDAAIGPLLACDARLMAAITWCCCEGGEENEHGGANGAAASGARLYLASYVSGMRVLLQGSAAERAAVAFRAFCGESENGPVGLKHTVQPADFQRTAADILDGLCLSDCAAAVTIDAGSDPMPFEAFCSAYDRLVAAVSSMGQEVKTQANARAPSLGFGSEHWVQLTYVMTGIDVASRTARGDGSKDASPLGRTCFAEKRTFDLSRPSPTIAACSDAPLLGVVGVASNFFRKRTPIFQSDRVTFSDYASSVFVKLRRRFGFSEESYMSSLGIRAMRARLLLGQLCPPRVLQSSGSSGALLLSSHDGKFILKRILPGESNTLRRILPVYVTHVQRHAHTFLPRYAGLYALTRSGEKKVFVVAENIFAHAGHPIAEVYDLKGSTLHRTTERVDRCKGAAGKDKDFIHEKRRLRLSAVAREALLAQLDIDTALLEECNALDYSFLVGIHRANGNAEISEGVGAQRAQQEKLGNFIAELHENSDYKNNNNNSNNKKKKAATDAISKADVGDRVHYTNETDINGLADDEGKWDKSFTELAQPSAFRAYRGGLASADGTEIYYFGFVDCLTAYGLKKVGEHYGKSMLLLDMKEVSCVPPPIYRTRFMEFIRSIIDDVEGT